LASTIGGALSCWNQPFEVSSYIQWWIWHRDS
jgi:hypothetical protein